LPFRLAHEAVRFAYRRMRPDETAAEVACGPRAGCLPCVAARPLAEAPCAICFDELEAEGVDETLEQMRHERQPADDGAAAASDGTAPDWRESTWSSGGEPRLDQAQRGAPTHAAVCCAPSAATRARQPRLTHCLHGCGRNFHALCISRWRSAREAWRQPECPVCRARWRSDDAAELPAPDSVAAAEGFVNLGALQPGLQTVRDSSTYSEWLTVHQRRAEQRNLEGTIRGDVRGAAV